MKSLQNVASLIAGLLFTCTLFAQQIPNAKTASVKVYGNCGMCEKTIEKAAAKKHVASADWDQDSQIAQLTFDSTKTNVDEILQRIAAVGYDSDKFRAPDTVYDNLHGCCQYERPAKAETAPAPATTHPTGMTKKAAVPAKVAMENPLTEVYSAYFSVKDALIASDAGSTAAAGKTLFAAVKNVKMEALSADQHQVWMAKLSKISVDAEHIQNATDIEKQRSYFITLSDNLFAVMKVVKPGNGETYLDHCPMANGGKGANWISREKPIKNPYYGKAMLTCGKVQETLQQ